MKVLKESFPYRFVETDDGDAGFIYKFNDMSRRWFQMYKCDSPLQLVTAMEDLEYTKWLDPEGVACYRANRGDSVKSPYK